MSGYLFAQRARFKHPLFAREKFCRGYAWDWLVAKAVYADTRISISGRMVVLRRGQLSYSIRYLADAWNWDKAAVSRFITRLKTETMIETGTETGQIVITICNYDKYQSPDKDIETASDTPSETPARQQRDSSETNKKEVQEREEERESTRAPETPDIVAEVREVTTPKPSRKKPASAMPPDAGISDSMMLHAVTAGFTEADARSEFDAFKDHALANARTLADWDAGWRGWLRKAHRHPSPSNRRPSNADRTEDAFAKLNTFLADDPFHRGY